MPKSLDEHADQWDLRDPDFASDDLLFEVYRVMRRTRPVRSHRQALLRHGRELCLGFNSF